MNYWNHYGELTQFTAKDQPSDPFTPTYAKYKGQIFPVNAVHSAWPAIYTEGEKGLHQPKMKDIYTMWTTHKKDKSKYPELALLKDNNNDSIPEVNRPEEIDAFINSVTAYMNDAGYELGKRKIVWVNNDRMYFNAKDYKTMEKETWESSPYASVYKYNHDVFPAKAGLGINGCTDCHSTSSKMLFGQVVKYPFGDDGNPVYEPQYTRLGMSAFGVWNSAIREQFIKTLQYPAFFFLLLVVALSVLVAINHNGKHFNVTASELTIAYIILTVVFALTYLKQDVASYILPSRWNLDKNHFYITVLALSISVFAWLKMKKERKAKSILGSIMPIGLIVTIAAGGLMMLKFDAIKPLVAVAYTLFDAGIVVLIFCSIVCLVKDQFKMPEVKA
jgi:hypothetical protein